VVLGPWWGPKFFQDFKTRANVESILNVVYRTKDNVNDELLDILLGPSDDDGAQDVFLAVFGGPPGPTPESILPTIQEIPILAFWGDSDPWTPFDQGVHPGSKFCHYHNRITYRILPNTGHCPHDENPEMVNEQLIEWLRHTIRPN
jgi:pimeloyl-ACP methyl ester carboxylesterase